MPATSDILAVLVDAGIKGIAILALAGAATLLMRRASAAARHLVWGTAMVGVVLLPAIQVLLPRWRVLPAPQPVVNLVEPSRPTLPALEPPPTFAIRPPAERPVDFAPQTPQTHQPPVTRVEGAKLANPVLVPAIQDRPDWNWRAILVLTWAGVAAAGLGSILLAHIRLCRLERRTMPVASDEISDLLPQLADEIGLGRRVRLLTADGPAMPMTWGVLSPRLLLPADAPRWSPQRLRMVMLHELAHVKRRDCLWLLMAQIVRALHWFNPLTSLAVRQMRAERERACDDLVLRAGLPAVDYADELVAFAAAGGAIPRAGIGIVRKGKLERRIDAILDPFQRRVLTRIGAAMAIVLPLVFLLPIAVLRAQQAKPAAAPTTQPTTQPTTKPTTKLPAAKNTRLEPGESGQPASTDAKTFIHVLNGRGEAVPDAQVWMVTDSPNFPICRPDGKDRAELLKTDRTGTVSAMFPAVPTNVTVTAIGFAPRFVRGADLQAKQPYDVRLDAGRTVTGSIVDAAGKPVVGATVKGQRVEFVLQHVDSFQPSGVTDEAGKFEFRHVADGKYQLTTELPAGDERLYTEAVVLDVPPQADPPPVTIPMQVGSVLKGRYTSADGLPVAKRRIHVFTRLPKERRWEAVTAEDGTFVISGFPAGATGGAAFWEGANEFIRVADPKARPPFESLLYQLNIRELPLDTYDGIEVRVGKLSEVTGTVRADGEPVAKAEVVVSDRNIYTADKKGRYVAKVPTGEPVVLKLFNPGQRAIEPRELPAFTLSSGEKAVRDFDTKRVPQEVADHIVTGRVVDEQGRPVPKARVELGNEALLPEGAMSAANGDAVDNSKPAWKGGFFWPARLVADEQGRFTFDQLYAGTTDLWAEDDNNRAGWAQRISSDARDVTIVVKSRGERLRIDVTVTDEAGKTAKGRAMLCTNENNHSEKLAEAVAGEDGRLVFDGPVRETHFQFVRMLFVADDGRIAWRTLPKCSGSTQIQLKPAAAITGQVIDGKKPVEGATARVSLVYDRDFGQIIFAYDFLKLLPTATTDRDGRFTLNGVTPNGKFNVNIEHPDFGRQQAATWTMATPTTYDAGTMILPKAVSIEGKVRFDDGKPAAGAAVKMGWELPMRDATTDANGKYTLRGIDQNWMRDNYQVIAARIGEPPEWTGSTQYAGKPSAGDRGQAEDIVLKRPLPWLRAQWMKSPAVQPASAYAVVKFDDVDKKGIGKAEYHDTATAFDNAGRQLWQLKNLNLNIWRHNHTIAQHPADGSTWVISNGLTKLKPDGAIAWSKPEIQATSIAFDPKTGHAWVLTSGGTIYGEKLLVIDPVGQIVRESKCSGFDLVYSPPGDCFWVVGQSLQQLNRDGRLTLTATEHFGWLAVNVNVNPTDGSVWVIEDDHPQQRDSKNRVLVFEPYGRLRRSMDLAAQRVLIDAPRNTVWLTGTTNGLMKLTTAGEIVGTFPVGAASADLEPDTGCLVFATPAGVLRVSPEGQYISGENFTEEYGRTFITVIKPAKP